MLNINRKILKIAMCEVKMEYVMLVAILISTISASTADLESDLQDVGTSQQPPPLSSSENKTSNPYSTSWVFNLNDNTFFQRNGNNKPTFYFPPLDGDEDQTARDQHAKANARGSMVTFYFLLGLFLLFAGMFFCWYFTNYESNEALRRHQNRASRRLSRRTRRIGRVHSANSIASSNRPYPEAHHISVIMPNDDGYYLDPPPMYNEIFSSEQDKKNSPYILPTYGEIMTSQKSLAHYVPTPSEEQHQPTQSSPK